MDNSFAPVRITKLSEKRELEIDPTDSSHMYDFQTERRIRVFVVTFERSFLVGLIFKGFRMEILVKQFL